MCIRDSLGIVQRYYDWDWGAAERSCTRALELAPDNAEALPSYGWLCYHTGRFELAESLFLRAIDTDPLRVDSYVGVGMLYRSMNRLADAERALRKAIELIPQGAQTRYVLALVLAQQGRDGEAVAVAMEEPTQWGRLTALV